LSKYDDLDKDGVEIHFIGSLQRNKVKYIADKVSMIHSLDSVSLAAEIDKQCAKLDKVMDVLIEINIAREESKGGIFPEELDGFYSAVRDFKHLRVAGLMTMAPAGAGEEGWRGYFRQAKELFDGFCVGNALSTDSPVLSMGMSASYRVALRSGSNMVRLGSSLFGERKVQ
ncbi:MAG: YggS family pyridoxal phosphate-dependent enzyme, partial [Clostridia bacterium]|nr:YggS family pyridoxal phosphate-dependent enzyme [Clostridia bacterium]